MIDGKRIVAFTPSGRQRYMDILWKIVEYEHALGHIDEWVLFNNSYSVADDQHTREFADRAPWVRVLSDDMPISARAAPSIFRFYRQLNDEEVVYLRLDDDICHVDPCAIRTLVRHKLANPKQFLTFPLIINNTRMSYFLQEAGQIPQWTGTPITDVFLEPTAWRDADFDFYLQSNALDQIYDSGRVADRFRIPDRELIGNSSDGVFMSHVSVNCFAIDGQDMARCRVTWDEEGYLSDHRPRQLLRHNGVCGSAVVCHFAYHPQTARMERSSLLAEYSALAHDQARPVRLADSTLKA